MTNQLVNLGIYTHSSVAKYQADFNMVSVRYVALIRPDGFMQVFQNNPEGTIDTVELSDFFDKVDDHHGIAYDFHNHVLILVKDHEMVGMVMRYSKSSSPEYNYPIGYPNTDPIPQDWIDELNVARVKALIGDAL